MGRFSRILFAFFFVISCTGKGGSRLAAVPESAFFTAQKSWCTIEENGVDKSDAIERFGEIFIFKGDQLTIKSFDLDANRRLQLNSKQQPKVKDAETAKFRVEKGSLFFIADQERKSEYTKITKTLDGKSQTCFQLKGSYTSTHCPCELPEAK